MGGLTRLSCCAIRNRGRAVACGQPAARESSPLIFGVTSARIDDAQPVSSPAREPPFIDIEADPNRVQA